MVRLLLKIFLAYWIAAGGVILISDLLPHKNIHGSELADALDASLAMNGKALAAAYESGNCPSMERRLANRRDSSYLASPDGRMLCGDASIAGASHLIQAAAHSNRRMISNYARQQLIAFPIFSSSGARYVLLLQNSYSAAVEVYGLLPGYTTITISCVVTLFLAVLLVLPIRQLRTAAGKIAMGKLDTRVQWNSPTARFTGGDDIDQLCRDFNHMAKRLQSLADAQRLLLCEVSHELRSPLTRLGVALGLARAESSPGMREHLYRIEAEASRLNHLIGQFLSLSRLDLLPQIEAPRMVSLTELIEDLLPDLEYEAGQVGCAIEANVNCDCYTFGDEELLRGTIENVARNAIKYAGDHVLIEVGVDCKEAGSSDFIIRVSDNGPGIPEHELPSVLKPFYRADRSRHWQQEGSGIGLAIAERAVKLHAGRIDICNRPGGGLRVEIRLPAVQQVAETSGTLSLR